MPPARYTPQGPGTAADVRAWAQANGYGGATDAPRGQLPRAVIDAYDAAHPGSPYRPDARRKQTRIITAPERTTAQ